MSRAKHDMPLLFVGTYAEAGGGGLYPLRRTGGEWALGAPWPGARNASFGASSRRHGLHYLVDEQHAGAVGAYSHADGGWDALGRAATGGAEPCYAALSPDENWLAVANYGSGSAALVPLDPATGLPGEPLHLRENTGSGPVADRQDAPHAHCTVFDPGGRWLYQTDLGTDEVRAFAFDPATGHLGEGRTAFRTPAGSGPRHLVLHPRLPLAVLVSELASTLTLLEVHDGEFTARQVVSTLPPGFTGESLGGHLGINAAGNRIYVTNRGHDSIATFALAEGELTLLGHTPAGDASPRFFLLLDEARTMLVANEQGNSVTIFDLSDDGVPVPAGRVAVPGAAFVFAA